MAFGDEHEFNAKAKRVKIVDATGGGLNPLPVTLSDETAGTTTLLDYVAGIDPIYVGKAEPGTDTSVASWSIFKLTYDGNGNVTEKKWADGTDVATKIWDNRTSYSYS